MFAIDEVVIAKFITAFGVNALVFGLWFPFFCWRLHAVIEKVSGGGW